MTDHIPSAIIARGTDVKKAYNEALKEGRVNVNLGMLKVIGQEGVGKTCLLNACLGLKFEEKHIVTNGIAVTRTVSTTWKEAEADSGNPSQQYKKVVTDKMMSEMESSAINESPNESTESLELNTETTANNAEQDDTPNETDVDKNSTVEGLDFMLSTSINKFDRDKLIQSSSGMNAVTTANNAEQGDTPIETKKDVGKKFSAKGTKPVRFDADQPLDKEVIHDFEQKKFKSLENTFNIWDHGGQLIYHGIHSIFMTSEALYIVVFDLSKPLDDLAKVIDATRLT
ncbi:uncharacterized protein [Antedon mediterranea]|uniref:uncharacterized protein n=1 Tax=Antedon mediterranea TaxID=105859 RepID=UPI003AF6CCFC